MLQAQTMIEGIIIDTKQTPIGYATIGIKGTTKSAMSNESGNFKLSLNKLPQIVIISAIGYNAMEVEINSTNITVSLTPKTYAINDIIINSDNAYQVFFKAYKKLLKPSYKYYNGNVFYRLVTKNDSIYTELMEGFYEAQVAPTGFCDWRLKHGRYAMAEDYKQQQYVVSIDLSALIRYVDITNDHQSNVKFPLFPFRVYAKKLYHFYNRGSVYLNGKELSKIEFIPKVETRESFSGIVYIDEKTSNLHRLETSFNAQKSLLITSDFGKQPAYNLSIRYIIDFAESSTHELLLSYINIDLQYEYAHLQNAKKINTQIQCVVYDKNASSKNRPQLMEIANMPSDYAAIRTRLYIKPFWAENTILTQTDTEKSITINFEQKGLFGQAYNRLDDTLAILKEGFALLNEKVNHLIVSIREEPATSKTPNCITLARSGMEKALLCSQLFVSHNCYKDSFYVLVLPLLDTTQTWISDTVKQEDSFSFIIGLYSKLTKLHAQLLHKQLTQISNPCEHDESIYQLTVKANDELYTVQQELLTDCWAGDSFKFWVQYLEKLEKEN